VSDRRYSTAAWQKLRRAVIARAGGYCTIQGPRCTGIATTADHILPSSTHPHLFWDFENLRASCRACNYGGGARVAADNRRRRTAQLEQFIIEQQQEIARLVERLAYYENGGALEQQQAEPRIY
jgi:5-methylcytosine-specific restriction endonuclease McrA